LEYDPDASERPSIPLQRVSPLRAHAPWPVRLVRARLAQTAPVSPFALTMMILGMTGLTAQGEARHVLCTYVRPGRRGSPP